jgi:hypothetical protein
MRKKKAQKRFGFITDKILPTIKQMDLPPNETVCASQMFTFTKTKNNKNQKVRLIGDFTTDCYGSRYRIHFSSLAALSEESFTT